MDFIGDNDAAVAEDNLAHAGVFRFGPEAADGVLGIAANYRFDTAVCLMLSWRRSEFTFQVFEIHGVAFAVKLQGVVHNFAAVLGDDRKKREIDRFLENDF